MRVHELIRKVMVVTEVPMYTIFTVRFKPLDLTLTIKPLLVMLYNNAN